MPWCARIHAEHSFPPLKNVRDTLEHISQSDANFLAFLQVRTKYAQRVCERKCRCPPPKTRNGGSARREDDRGEEEEDDEDGS